MDKRGLITVSIHAPSFARALSLLLINVSPIEWTYSGVSSMILSKETACHTAFVAKPSLDAWDMKRWRRKNPREYVSCLAIC